MDTKTKAIPELSLETQTLVRVMLPLTQGDIITYETLSDAAGMPVQAGHGDGTGYGRLGSARRILERDHNMVFAAVAGVGLKLMDEDGRLGIGISSVDGIRRKARKTGVMLAKTDQGKMTNEARIQLNTTASVCGVIHAFTKPKMQKAIAGKVSQGQEALPVGKTIEAFMKE
jgi:alkylated DNA nucleotide flippase Atl1